MFAAVVDSTAVLTRSFFFSTFCSRGSGYANVDGLALQSVLKSLGIFMSLFSPMMAVGLKVRLSAAVYGYQYQCCKNMVMPATAAIFRNPAADCSDTTMLRPPAATRHHESYWDARQTAVSQSVSQNNKRTQQ